MEAPAPPVKAAVGRKFSRGGFHQHGSTPRGAEAAEVRHSRRGRRPARSCGRQGRGTERGGDSGRWGAADHRRRRRPNASPILSVGPRGASPGISNILPLYAHTGAPLG
ncbi:hypothetical protein E2C01_095250 [Portunus trituberculatus]|uniref:Uncharacterized protein n=1 Tax=Portunus trituberculatus TaxID=210409 RepID=A0A5B7JSK6_PORTR|nr:hypothetical protein [Portunus trituberculatus]